MCLSNGSSEFGNPTPLFFVIALKCLPACRAASSAFQIENGPSSAAYCHFYYFSALKFFNRTLHFFFSLAEKEMDPTSALLFIDLILRQRISLFVQLSFIYDFISGCYYDAYP